MNIAALRWFKRYGKLVLQSRSMGQNTDGSLEYHTWEDVPIVEEMTMSFIETLQSVGGVKPCSCPP